MKEQPKTSNTDELSEIKVLLAGTRYAPEYLKIKNQLSNNQLPSASSRDATLEAMMTTYIPTLGEEIEELKSNLERLKTFEQTLVKKQRQYKLQSRLRRHLLRKRQKRRPHPTNDKLKTEITSLKQKISECKKQHYATQASQDFFDNIGETTIHNKKVAIGYYRGAGTQKKFDIVDALFGNSMEIKASQIAADIYAKMLASSNQSTLPTINIHGFSRGAFTALLITELINKAIADGPKEEIAKIERAITKQEKKLHKSKNHQNTSQEQLYIDELQRRKALLLEQAKQLQTKKIRINTQANDPIPGVGNDRITGVFNFDHPKAPNTRNYVNTQYNTAHNSFGFSGENINQIISSLSGINQHHYVQSAALRHGGLQAFYEPNNTKNNFYEFIDQAFKKLKKENPPIPDYFHPQTICGLYNLNQQIRQIRIAHGKNDNTEKIIQDLLKNANKELQKEKELDSSHPKNQDIPELQEPDEQAQSLLNTFMTYTIQQQIQMQKTNSIVGTHTGGILQSAVDNKSILFGNNRVYEQLREHESNMTPFEVEYILGSFNTPSISRTITRARYIEYIRSTYKEHKPTTFKKFEKQYTTNPADIQRNESRGHMSNYLLNPIIFMGFYLQNPRLDTNIRNREKQKKILKKTILCIRKELPLLMLAKMETSQDTLELKELLEQSYDIDDNIKLALAIKNSRAIQEKTMYEPFLKINDLIKNLDLIYRDIHICHTSNKKIYQEELNLQMVKIQSILRAYHTPETLQSKLYDTIDAEIKEQQEYENSSNIKALFKYIRNQKNNVTQAIEKRRLAILRKAIRLTLRLFNIIKPAKRLRKKGPRARRRY